MLTTPVETLFTALDSTAEILQEELSISYLDALAETGENLFHGDILQEEVSELSKRRIKKQYETIDLSTYTKEELRRGYQLAILKGMKENTQPNHQMTPDAVALFIGYLVDRFTAGQTAVSILDPTVGTGNLLAAVMNQLKDKEVYASGVDVDDTLIKLAYINANLQEHPIQFFNQDSLEPLFIDPVDLIVCDLPVGYYPNDVRAKEYELKTDEGHSYAHHLLIEQSVKHAKKGAYLFFLIPNQLFESPEAPKLNAYIKEYLTIQGLFQLPMSMFNNKQAAKSILVLQKKKEGITPPKQALLVDMPKLSNQQAVEQILQKINVWIQENKKN